MLRVGPLPEVPAVGREALIPPTELLRADDDISPESGRNRGELPPKDGVPVGVDRAGILGGGGVPIYCARRTRALGEDELAASIGAGCRGLVILTGFEGEVMMYEYQEKDYAD